MIYLQSKNIMCRLFKLKLFRYANLSLARVYNTLNIIAKIYIYRYEYDNWQFITDLYFFSCAT